MDGAQKISTVRYWNYIVAPVATGIALFGIYTLINMGNLQRASSMAVMAATARLRSKNGE